MYTKWTAHLKDEHSKTQFEMDVRRAKPVLERLKDLLEQDLKGLSRNSLDFGSPSWPYLQAYKIGAENILAATIQLIDLDKQKDNTNE